MKNRDVNKTDTVTSRTPHMSADSQSSASSTLVDNMHFCSNETAVHSLQTLRDNRKPAKNLDH